MAGHSQFKNIMHRKGAQDAKRARTFAKIAREIMVAARSGIPEPGSNPRLRAALASARAANMPKDNVDRAMKKALGGDDGAVYEEVRYEGYGPGGVAVIVETLTDNRNRTASEVRSYFNKHGGNLGESGSVSFSFERLGLLEFDAGKFNFDQVFEAALEAGADNVEAVGETLEVTCSLDAFASVRDHLIEHLGDPLQAKVFWRPVNTIECNEDTARTLVKLVDVLEDNDDVQHVYANFEVSDEVAAKLST
ncbi:YebC/PmpR family DNA-binding transcriptional regulator [Candidatus Finniella inopinata]|uniref:Probable transcriptional regulatory protein EQU50_05725 n=1 Tax=Candidatus Finniella inopinata TaxID=1696036 RepID=A0A4Q7DHV5_9PROT|nr:YebC/PmpR family DNA-binding transcriptional regulator [Candidatus Finniella inopinata]RZI45930.1 YebC/PmpR family DNA-binding transcriptional regulator [Candidatus Finniella inopinata]